MGALIRGFTVVEKCVKKKKVEINICFERQQATKLVR